MAFDCIFTGGSGAGFFGGEKGCRVSTRTFRGDCCGDGAGEGLFFVGTDGADLCLSCSDSCRSRNLCIAFLNVRGDGGPAVPSFW